MSPQEELRAAAKLLRETAAKATPGPWDAGHITGIGWCVSDTTISICVATEDGWVSKGDVSWIALANPVLAEPLANLLDHITTEQNREPCDGAPGVCNRCELDPTVLLADLVARAILPADDAEETR